MAAVDGARAAMLAATKEGERMAIWNCPSCGEDNDSDFGICWNCGAQFEGGDTGPALVHDEGLVVESLLVENLLVENLATEVQAPEARDLRCPRCGAAMQALGRLRLHEGAPEAPLAQGLIGERLVDRTSLDAYACTGPGCGKVELFSITLAEVSRVG